MPGARSEDRKRSVLFSCLPLLLQSHAERIPHRPAILCVAGAWPPPLQVKVKQADEPPSAMLAWPMTKSISRAEGLPRKTPYGRTIDSD